MVDRLWHGPPFVPLNREFGGRRRVTVLVYPLHWGRERGWWPRGSPMRILRYWRLGPIEVRRFRALPEGVAEASAVIGAVADALA